MELTVHSTGVVDLDGLAVGSWSVDSSGNHGVLNVRSERLEFDVLGPFGQGYTVQVTGSERPKLELSYSWRDGYEVSGAPSESDLRLEDTALKNGDMLLASVSWTSRYVRLRFAEGLGLPDVVRYAVALAMNRFFADKTGPFSRTPRP